ALAYSYAQGKKELKSFGTAASDDRGEFRIAGLPPGAYYLRGAAFPRTVMSSMRVLGPKAAYELAPTYFPSAADPTEAVLLDLAPGGELRNHNITLRTEQSYTIRVTIAGNRAAGSSLSLGVRSPRGMGR